MTDDKVIEAANGCRDIIVAACDTVPVAKRMDIGKYPFDVATPELVGHLLYCCEQIVVLIRDGRREKAMRWLGFVQGALWANNLATIEYLGGLNKPSGSVGT